MVIRRSSSSTTAHGEHDGSKAARLTCIDGGLALQGERLQALLVGLQAEVAQILLDLACHLSILIQLLGIKEGAAAHALLVAARLVHVQHSRIGTALTEGAIRKERK